MSNDKDLVQDDNPQEHSSCEHDLQIEALNKKLEAAIQENNELKNRWLRAEANLQNAQKAHQKELEEAKVSIEDRTIAVIAMKLANISDTFSIAMQNDPATETFRDGVNMIYKSFLSLLEEIGISIITPEGQQLDHYEHQVVGTKMSTDIPTNTIISVLQPGYKLGKRVIRPARVIVSVQG